MIPGLHLPELIIVLAVALLIFGPKKLPEMGQSIGKSIKEFKKGMSELTEPKEEDKVPNLDAIEREIAAKKAAAEANEAMATEAKVAKEAARTEENVG